VQPGDSLLLQNAPRGYLGTLWPVPDDVTVTGDVSQGPFDIVQTFIRDPVGAEATLNDALDVANTCRVFWVTIQQDSNGAPAGVPVQQIKRTLEAAGWEERASFKIDIHWLAMRFDAE
jgi:hypothetical protein